MKTLKRFSWIAAAIFMIAVFGGFGSGIAQDQLQLEEVMIPYEAPRGATLWKAYQGLARASQEGAAFEIDSWEVFWEKFAELRGIPKTDEAFKTMLYPGQWILPVYVSQGTLLEGLMFVWSGGHLVLMRDPSLATISPSSSAIAPPSIIEEPTGISSLNEGMITGAAERGASSALENFRGEITASITTALQDATLQRTFVAEYGGWLSAGFLTLFALVFLLDRRRYRKQRDDALGGADRLSRVHEETLHDKQDLLHELQRVRKELADIKPELEGYRIWFDEKSAEEADRDFAFAEAYGDLYKLPPELPHPKKWKSIRLCKAQDRGRFREGYVFVPGAEHPIRKDNLLERLQEHPRYREALGLTTGLNGTVSVGEGLLS